VLRTGWREGARRGGPFGCRPGRGSPPAVLLLCRGRPGHQRRRLEWERISEGLSVLLLFRQSSEAIVDLLAGQRPVGAGYLRNACPLEILIQLQRSVIVAEVFCQNGERQLRRPAPAISPFEAGRAVVAELLARVEGLRSPFPSIVQTTHPCGPRRPVYIFLLRAWCSVVLVSAFIVLPFMGSKTLPAGRFATTGQGRRAPVRLLRMIASKPGPRRERSRDAPLRRRKRKRQRFISLVPSWYRYVLAFTGLAELPMSVRLSVWRTASCSLEKHGHRVVLLSNYRPWRGESCAPRL
jgi:hypothetical protein